MTALVGGGLPVPLWGFCILYVPSASYPGNANAGLSHSRRADKDAMYQQVGGPSSGGM
jgi:hypothetical protein